VLKRAKSPMSPYVQEALDAHALQDAYDARPPCQRNDYLRWISSAKREAIQRRRWAAFCVLNACVFRVARCHGSEDGCT
jgi:uncharacterized protein YdeI (YjbR/CyaY-like superfamily)